MSEKLFPVIKNAHINEEQYKALYKESIENPEAFWAREADRIDWIKKWNRVKNSDFKGDVNIKWFEGAKLNVCYNCVDRHAKATPNRTAIIWEGDDPKNSKYINYQELYHEVCKFANVLKQQGIKKGDRVIIYLPMIPEAAYAMLACARIGAVHSVVFGGFSAEALRSRIEDARASLIITADQSMRGGKTVPLKENVDQALGTSNIKVIVVKRTGNKVPWNHERDIWYSEAAKDLPTECEIEVMDAEDPLFILYTSGSTGKPKGALHTSGGYLVYASITHQYIFDIRSDDIYWCTADVGWITGHTYIVYGPLANGATTLIYEGVPQYPDFSRLWQVVDKHKVTIFYTAPTAIRALRREGEEPLLTTSRKTLRLLGSVGEPINPEAWLWYYTHIGNSKCPIVDTWWQTETGGILITPLPGAIPQKPGSATLPFFGIIPVIVNQQGKVMEGEAEGYLCIADSWPGQMRTVYGDHKRFVKTYFLEYTGLYFTGDGARRDKDGYYWITGRVDDVLNVSGHRLGTAEIESALVANPHVAEAAVVGFPHDIKGQGIYAYVILNADTKANDNLNKDLIKWVRKSISPIATPDRLICVPGLPKTRSGKIMRRILRKIAENNFTDFGDINTLVNPEIVDQIITIHKSHK